MKLNVTKKHPAIKPTNIGTKSIKNRQKLELFKEKNQSCSKCNMGETGDPVNKVIYGKMSKTNIFEKTLKLLQFNEKVRSLYDL